MIAILDGFFNFLLAFGLLGVFILAFLDSTFFFFLPFAVDAVFIVLTSRDRNLMPEYAIVTIVGSILGCALTYLLISKASEETLEKKLLEKKFDVVKKKLKKKGFLGMLITSLLPPPFPFTVFVMAAGAMQLPKKQTFAAISIGRTLRYSLEGTLAVILGSQILKLFQSHAFKAFMFGLFVLAVIGSSVTIYRWIKRS